MDQLLGNMFCDYAHGELIDKPYEDEELIGLVVAVSVNAMRAYLLLYLEYFGTKR